MSWKKKIYLDTSVISYLLHEDTPDKRNDTLTLWEIIKRGIYDVYISELTLEELSACPEPKKSTLFELLKQIEYNLIRSDVEVEELALDIIKQSILTNKSVDDCTHIAAAVLNSCNIIVSWNFKHLVNARTIDGIRIITIMKNLKSVDIYSPTMLIEGVE